MRRLTASLLFALLAAACSSSSSSSKKQPDSPAPTFALEADQASLNMLDGRWEGEYVNETAGRTGSIVLEFAGKEAQGHGDVLMIPKGSTEPLRPSKPAGGDAALRQMPQILTIRFVKAEGGTLSGRLDPHRSGLQLRGDRDLQRLDDRGCPPGQVYRDRAAAWGHGGNRVLEGQEGGAPHRIA